MVAWRDGAPNGLEVYDPLDDDTVLLSDFEYTVTDNVLEVRLPLEPLGLTMGQTISFSAFQEGASDGWLVDWVESAEFTVSDGALPGIGIPNEFEGDAHGFKITLTDEGDATADPETVGVRLDGAPATATASNNSSLRLRRSCASIRTCRSSSSAMARNVASPMVCVRR